MGKNAAASVDGVALEEEGGNKRTKMSRYVAHERKRGREREKTHDDFGVDPAGLVKIFTFIIATRPSTAFTPLAPTVKLWLIPTEVFGR